MINYDKKQIYQTVSVSTFESEKRDIDTVIQNLVNQKELGSTHVVFYLIPNDDDEIYMETFTCSDETNEEYEARIIREEAKEFQENQNKLNNMITEELRLQNLLEEQRLKIKKFEEALRS